MSTRHPIGPRLLRGWLREFAKSLKMDEANLTDDEIRQKLREYLAGRLEADKMQERIADIERWMEANDIPLLPGGDWLSALSDNAELKAKDPAAYYRLIAGLLVAYDDWAMRLRADGIPFTDETIKHILLLMYRSSPRPGQFLEDLFATAGRPASSPSAKGNWGVSSRCGIRSSLRRRHRAAGPSPGLRRCSIRPGRLWYRRTLMRRAGRRRSSAPSRWRAAARSRAR